MALWDSVKDGDAGELDTYLEQYPEGTFAALALKRRDAEGVNPAATEIQAGMPEAFDLAFWESIKDSDSAEPFTAYLGAHPNGHFVALARARLATAQAPHVPAPADIAAASAVELAFWGSIQDAGEPTLFAAYLEKYPEGEFAVIARARLSAEPP